MSAALAALSAEVVGRGSMLQSAAEYFLVNRYGVDAAQAAAVVASGAPEFYRLSDGGLYPSSAKENPAPKSCKCRAKAFDAIVALPAASRNPTKQANPVKMDADPASEANVAGSKRPANKEQVPMAKKAKTGGSKPKAKKSGSKPRRTAKQRAATKRMIAANKARAKGVATSVAASKPKAKRTAKPKAKRTAKPKAKRTAKPKRRTASKATSRRTAPPKSTASASVRVAVQGGGAASAKTRKGTVRRGKGRKAKRNPSPGYSSARWGGFTSHPSRRGWRNPVGTAKTLGVAVVGVFGGVALAEIADRLTVALTNVKDKDGKYRYQLEGKDVVHLNGLQALFMREAQPEWPRFVTAGVGTLAFGFGAYALRKKSDVATAALGGMAVGFGLKLAGLGVRKLLPMVMKVENRQENTWVNALFPENASVYDPTTSETKPVDMINWAGSQSPSMVAGVPPWRRANALPRSTVSGADFGPAAGTVGCACGKPDCPKGRAPQAPSAPDGNGPRPGTVVEVEAPPAAGTVGQAQPEPAVTPVAKKSARPSLADTLESK